MAAMSGACGANHQRQITVVVVDDHPAVTAGVRAWCAAASPPITVVASGTDVGVAWLEAEWVLASVVPTAGPSRLERLLRDLGEIADIVDPFDEDYDAGRHQASAPIPSSPGTPASGTPVQPPADPPPAQD